MSMQITDIMKGEKCNKVKFCIKMKWHIYKPFINYFYFLKVIINLNSSVLKYYLNIVLKYVELAARMTR